MIPRDNRTETRARRTTNGNTEPDEAGDETGQTPPIAALRLHCVAAGSVARLLRRIARLVGEADIPAAAADIPGCCGLIRIRRSLVT